MAALDVGNGPVEGHAVSSNGMEAGGQCLISPSCVST